MSPTPTRPLTLPEIDAKLLELQACIHDYHAGRDFHYGPVTCRQLQDELLDTRHGLTHP